MLIIGLRKRRRLIATYRIGESSRCVVSWLGYGTTNITAFYVNIWKIDNATGVWTSADHSPNLLDLDLSWSTPAGIFVNC